MLNVLIYILIWLGVVALGLVCLRAVAGVVLLIAAGIDARNMRREQRQREAEYQERRRNGQLLQSDPGGR